MCLQTEGRAAAGHGPTRRLSSAARDRQLGYTAPMRARTRTLHHPTGPVAYDFVKPIFILSEFGEERVRVGDVVALGANTLCGSEPVSFITATTRYLDRDHVVHQVFWQHAAFLADRLHAQDFAEELCSEPANSCTLAR